MEIQNKAVFARIFEKNGISETGQDIEKRFSPPASGVKNLHKFHHYRSSFRICRYTYLHI